MDKKTKDILWLSSLLVHSRGGDISSDDGWNAAVDMDLLMELEERLASYFNLPSDDIDSESIKIIRDKLLRSDHHEL